MIERDPSARTPAQHSAAPGYVPAEAQPVGYAPQPTRRQLRTGGPGPVRAGGSAPVRRVDAASMETGPILLAGVDRDTRTAPVAHRASPSALRPTAPRAVAPRPAAARAGADAPSTRYSSSATAELRRKTGMRRILCALAAVVTVPGLVATAALPAYSQTFSVDPSYSSSTTGSQSLLVPVDVAGETISRSGIIATSDTEMAARRLDNARAKRAAAYNASGATAAGDDYPWPYEAADVEGGGLSALGYYYRECVDFVAWRLNRDAGSTSGPWKYTWSKLTPNGGNASQWASNWRAHGWATGSEPVAGSVAWFNGNHVAYVKEVPGDGTVVIEEYNHGMSHKYGIRTLAISDIALFLYAPPL